MIDDYQYIASQLTPKNEGPFGFGGKPNEGSRGFSGIIVDSGSLTDPSSFNPSLQGPQGPQGPQGAEGPEGPLIGGNLGDMLYHDGSDWVTFGGTSNDGLLRMEQNSPSWFLTSSNGIVVSNGETNQFEILQNAPNSVLKTNDSNELFWQYFPDGNDYGDMLFWNGSGWSIIQAASGGGIHVLASSGGTPYWIQTEACDA
jgi:hypothetical protein